MNAFNTEIITKSCPDTMLKVAHWNNVWFVYVVLFVVLLIVMTKHK